MKRQKYNLGQNVNSIKCQKIAIERHLQIPLARDKVIPSLSDQEVHMSVFLLEHFWGTPQHHSQPQSDCPGDFLMSFPGSVDGVKVRKEEEGRGEESSILPRWLTLFPSYTDSCFQDIWLCRLSCPHFLSRLFLSTKKWKYFQKGVLKIWAFLKILYNYRLTTDF